MKRESPKTLAEVRERMVEIERKRAEDYKWLLDEVAKDIHGIAQNEVAVFMQHYKHLVKVKR